MITVLTTTYNCEKFIRRSLQSIKNQNFKEFKCYITDDMSTDNTVGIIKEMILGDDRFILIENQTKRFQPGNYDYVIRNLNTPDDNICIEVDGDDWLPNSDVLSLINETYNDKNVWMTSGSFIYHDGRTGFASPPSDNSDIRKQNFTLSHLRTWKSWLWKKIKEEDLKDEDGTYWKVAGDLSFMFPMFEMSGIEHFRFLSTINYVYNESNPINDHKVNLPTVFNIVNKIRSKPKYEKL